MRKKVRIQRNSIPFLLLAFLHLSMIFLLLKKKNQKSTWILMLSNMGFAYLFEYVVLNLFNAYKYKPKVFKNRYFDNIFGAILSQGIYVPITSTFLTVFKKSWKWKIGFSTYFFLSELIFIRLKVYKDKWWSPLYTLLLINLYFFISDMFSSVYRQRRKWALYIAHFFVIEVISVTLLYVLAVKRNIRFGLGRYHTWKEHFIVVPLYSLYYTYSCVENSSKEGLQHRVQLLFKVLVLDCLLKWIGLLKLTGKQCIANIPFHLFMNFISRYFYTLIFRKN